MQRAVDTRDRRFLKIRALATALPGVIEKPSHGFPYWRTTKAQFAAYNEVKGFPTLYVLVEEDLLLAATKDPRYFDSGYVRRGKKWLALRLDPKPDWDEVQELLARAYELAKPQEKKPRAPRVKKGSGARAVSIEPGGTGRGSR